MPKLNNLAPFANGTRNIMTAVHAQVLNNIRLLKIGRHLSTFAFIGSIGTSYYMLARSSEICYIPHFCDMGLNYQLDPYLFIFMCILLILFYTSLHFTRSMKFRLCFLILLVMLLGINIYNVWCYHYYISRTAIYEDGGKIYLCTIDRKWKLRSFRILPGKTKYNDHYNCTYDDYNPYSAEVNTYSDPEIQRLLSLLDIHSDQNIAKISILPTFPVNHLSWMVDYRHMKNFRNIHSFVMFSFQGILYNLMFLFIL
jgi:hypothetical protein